MPSETSQVSGLTGRYAVAIFDLAVESGSLDSVASDLDAVQAVLNESEDFRNVTCNPLLARDIVVSVTSAVLEKVGVSNTVLNFVRTVGANRRLNVLSEIIRDFKVLLAAHRGEVAARVISADNLTPIEADALRVALSKKLGSNVALTSQKDPSLIGGVVVRLGSQMYDGSVKTKLQNLKLAMKGVE